MNKVAKGIGGSGFQFDAARTREVLLRFLALALLAALCVWLEPARAQADIVPNRGVPIVMDPGFKAWWTTPSTHMVTLATKTLSIRCGSGSVIVHMDNGEVEYKNCDPGEGARAFWAAVSDEFPSRRAKVLRCRDVSGVSFSDDRVFDCLESE